jgi:hypothetical protein
MPTEVSRDERRRQLYEDAARAFSPTSADELMSLLPPAGWHELATKQDVAMLGTELRSDIARLDTKIDVAVAGLERKIERVDGKLDRSTERLAGKIDGLQRHLDATGSMRTWFLATLLASIGAIAAIAAFVAAFSR